VFPSNSIPKSGGLGVLQYFTGVEALRHVVFLDSEVPARLFSGWRHVIKTGVSDSAITVDRLEKSFPKAQRGWRALLQPFASPSTIALRGVCFQMKAGEAVALLGTNGAGKSTLLRVLATLLVPTHGRAIVAGHDCAREPRAVRRQLGYHAGSDLGFYARLTGEENLRFFGQLNHLSGAYLRSRIATLSEQFGLGTALTKQVRTLSAGTIQRLSLLRAILHEPKVLLLDEPTRSLDALAAADFRTFLRTEVLQRQGTSLLFASHTLSEIEFLADRIAILREGELVAIETPEVLKSRSGAATLEEAFSRLTGHAAYSLQDSAPS
jgi:ABC-type multidrug transport system ATPase subunit